jgi:hypothetical protein
MKRAALLALALSVALVACGGSSTSGGAGSTSVQVAYAPTPLRVGPVTWTVTVTNRTGHGLALTFPSGKRADVSLEKGGKAVYQWGRGMLFTQLVTHLTIAAGGRRAFTLDEPGLEVDPGDYTLVVVLAVAGHPELRSRTPVTVRGR